MHDGPCKNVVPLAGQRSVAHRTHASTRRRTVVGSHYLNSRPDHGHTVGRRAPPRWATRGHSRRFWLSFFDRHRLCPAPFRNAALKPPPLPGLTRGVSRPSPVVRGTAISPLPLSCARRRGHCTARLAAAAAPSACSQPPAASAAYHPLVEPAILACFCRHRNDL